MSSEDFSKKIKGYDILIVETDVINEKMIRQTPNLFAIVDFRGTVINVDIDAATENGVIIINTPGRNADGVADLAVAFMIMATRQLPTVMQAMKDGLWVTKGKYWMYTAHQGYDLPGKVIGLIGLGAIGQLVAKRLKGFGANIIAYDPYVKAEDAANLGIDLVSKEEVFTKSDFVSLHLPLNEQTKGAYGIKELSLLKPTAYLINTSRAAVFVEDELINFLKEEKIAGAAFDVYHNEPIGADHPLLHIPNVICTPHIGGATLDVVNHQCEIGINSLINFIEGKIPGNIINPTAIKRAVNKLNH